MMSLSLLGDLKFYFHFAVRLLLPSGLSGFNEASCHVGEELGRPPANKLGTDTLSQIVLNELNLDNNHVA